MINGNYRNFCIKYSGILTSHINSDIVPSIISLRRTSFPSKGPNHVPAGMFFNEHAPNLAPGILEMHKATPSGGFIFLSTVVSSSSICVNSNSLLLLICLQVSGSSLSLTDKIDMILWKCLRFAKVLFSTWLEIFPVIKFYEFHKFSNYELEPFYIVRSINHWSSLFLEMLQCYIGDVIITRKPSSYCVVM